MIGTVWSVLFAFISLAAALVYAAYDMRKQLRHLDHADHQLCV
ncbi:hypothetical protein PO124_19795 [Bacillus licheniformis]|nr:hypothetical protein [Bacillus licheniformis]